MLPWVREHVYHPDSGGSFSLKVVAPALLGDDGYESLEIRDGQTASNALQRLLLSGDQLNAEAQRQMRAALLAYCGQDLLVLVRLLQRLRRLAR